VQKVCPNCGFTSTDNSQFCIVCDFDMNKTYFDVLEIEVTDDISVIKKAFNAQIIKCHPDKTVNLSKEIQKLSDRKMKQLNHIMDVLKNEQTRKDYIAEISALKEIVVCPSCKTKNRVQKNQKSKCGKCKELLNKEKQHSSNTKNLHIDDYIGYENINGITETLGVLRNHGTLCFIAIPEQIGVMWRWFLAWMFTGYILNVIANIIFSPSSSLWFWVISGICMLILGPFVAGLIFRKQASLVAIRDDMKDGNLLGAIETCELMAHEFEKDDKLRLIYANILYVAGHYSEEVNTQKHLFERAIGLVDSSIGKGEPKMKDTTLLFLADLYEKSKTVFDIKVRHNENEINSIIERYKMKISSEEAKNLLTVSIVPWSR
jgi:uncharacterized protein YbaR (Trm112 family)